LPNPITPAGTDRRREEIGVGALEAAMLVSLLLMSVLAMLLLVTIPPSL
jgi:hypothetical protein